MRGRMGREGEIEVAAGVSSFAFVIFQGEMPGRGVWKCYRAGPTVLPPSVCE